MIRVFFTHYVKDSQVALIYSTRDDDLYILHAINNERNDFFNLG